MKLSNYFYLTILLVINYTALAQMPFEKTYSNTQSNQQYDGVDVIELNSGDYLLATANGLIKTDINGNIISDIEFSNFGVSSLNYVIPTYDDAMLQLNNNNILIAGGGGWMIIDPNTLLPINLPGFTDPINRFNNVFSSMNIISITKRNNGEIILLGHGDITATNVPHPSVTVLNPDGTFKKHFELTNPYFQYGHHIFTVLLDVHPAAVTSTNDNGYVITGGSNRYHPNYTGQGNDIFVIKFDVNDNIVWQHFYGENVYGTDDEPTDIIELHNGDLLISSHLNSAGNMNAPSGGLVRMDASGNVLWAKRYFKPNSPHGPNDLLPYGVVEKNNNELYFIGLSFDNPINSPIINESVLLNLNANNGNLNYAYTHPNAHHIQDIDKVSGNNFLMTGRPPINPQKEYSTLLKTDIDGKTGCEAPIPMYEDNVTLIRYPSEFTAYNLGSHIAAPEVTFTGSSSSNRCCQTTVNITGSTGLCPNSIGTLTADPGFASYLWTPGGQTTQQISILSPGTYTVDVTDANGCTGTASITVNPLSGPDTPILSGSVAACDNGTYTITNCQPGVSYNWNIVNGTPTTSTGCSTSINWTNQLLGGSINIIATDANGCTSTMIFNVYECCEPTTGINIVNTSSSLLPNSGFVTNNITNTTITTFRTNSPNNVIGINGTLTVDNDLNITDANIELAPSAKIIIQNGATLTIDNNSFLHACSDKLWNSITIEPLGKLIIFDSKIDDALRAVESINGGDFKINNTIFNNNHTGIYVDTYTGNHTGLVGGSTFRSNGFLLAPYAGERAKFGVVVNKVESTSGAGITIGNTSANNNLFRRLDVGIHSINSNIKIVNNRFIDILPVPLSASLSPTTGIWLEGDNTMFSFLSTAIIGGTNTNQRNTFVNCENGIIASYNMNITVSNNRLVTIKKVGVYINNFFHLISPSTVNISKNDVINAGIGINVIASVLPTTVIQENRLINMTYGQQTAIRCWDAFNSPFIPTNTLIANNKIRNAAVGIDVMRYKDGLIRDNKVRDISSTIPANPSYGIKVQASQNITLNNNTVRQVSVSSPNTFGISVQLSENILTTCNTTRQTEVGIQVAGPSPGTAIHQNTFRDNTTGFLLSNNGFMDDQFRGTITNKLPSDNKWVGNFTFGTDVELGSNNPPTLDFYARTTGNFVSSINGGGASAIVFIPTTGLPGLCVATPPPPTPVLKQITLGNVGNTADEIAIAEASLYHKLQLDTFMLNDIDYSNFNNTCNTADYGTLMHTNNALADPIATNLTTQLAQCQATSPNTNPSINLKEVALIALNNRINNTILDTTQISALQTLAAKCPFTDGIAVYQARALLAPVDTTVYYNFCESYTPSGNNERIITKPTLNNNDISIYPNPTHDLLFIQSDEQLVKEVNIYSISGQIIKNYTSRFNIINVDFLKNGIYYIKITTDNNSIIKKFVKN